MTATNTNKVRSAPTLRTSKSSLGRATDMETVTPEPATRHENQKIEQIGRALDRELDVFDRGLANIKSILDRADARIDRTQAYIEGMLTMIVVELFAIVISILIRWAVLVGGAR